MADRSSERDRRVKQLMGNRNPGFDVLGQAQAEIQDAQSELYNHIALQNSQEQARLREASTITQVAGGMMAMEGGGDQLRAQAASMNPSTQATLGKYGVKPSHSQTSSRNFQTQRVVSKTGDTTNIRNENITNNRTDIKVTQPSIPVQSSPIVVNGGGARKEDSTAKFKAWLSEMFARQQNEAEIQKKEYRKKEWNLGRTTSKLMKKIGEATSNLGERLDPKNMTSSLGGQLKWLLLIFGATMIGKVWNPIMKTIANIEGGIRTAFGWDMNEDLRRNSTKALSVVDQIRAAIGIDPKKENTTLVEGIGRVFMEGINKLIDKLQFWFEDRATSMKEVEFPKIKTSVIHPFESMTNALKGVGQYLGDLITVAFGGTKGKVKVEANKLENQSRESFTNTKGKQLSRGDEGLMTGSGRNYMRNSDYDLGGNLKGNASSTQAMSRSIISMFNDTKGHTTEISVGLSQLFNSANRNGQIAIDPLLLEYLGLDQKDIVGLKSGGMLTQKAYRIIPVKPTEAQKTEMGAYNGHWGFGLGGAGGSAAGTWAGIKAGTYLGGKAGLALSGATGGASVPIFTIGGAVLGGGFGFLTGGALGSGAGAGMDALVRDWTSKGYYPKLVPAESSEVGDDGSKGVGRMLWVIDSKGVNKVKSIITKDMKDKSTDLVNKEFTDFIKRRGEAIAYRNGRVLGKEALDTNDFEAARAQYTNMKNLEYNKFDSLEEGTEAYEKYRHINALMKTTGEVIDKGKNWVADKVNWTGGQIKGMNIGDTEKNIRAAWLMKLAMKYGFTKEQAAGIAGNAMRESSMKTETAYNSNDGGEPSGGLVGWRGNNCKQVLRYARDLYKCNVNPDNHQDIKKVPFEVQADILMRTLTGELEYGGVGFGKRAGDMIRRSSSVADSVKAMERYYEISGDYAKDEKLTKRTNYANNFYKFNLSTINVDEPAPNSPLYLGGNDGMMVGKSGGTTPSRIRNWLWGGTAPTEYNEKDKEKAISLMVRVKVPIHNYYGEEGYMSLTVNKKLKDDVVKIFTEIFENVPMFCINPKKTGAFNFKSVKGNPKALSNHALGSAIDINWEVNGYEDYNTENTRSHLGTEEHPVVQIFYRHGWIWGGTWDNKDKMHFEFGSKDVKGLDSPNSVLDTVGDAVIAAGDWIKPGGTESTTSLTKEQQDSINVLKSYATQSGRVRASSLRRGGAKVDEYGRYVDVGNGVHAYLKDDASPLNGALTGDDVAFVARKNSQTGRLENLTKEEEDIARNSVYFTMASMFTSYKGKGSREDRMTDKNGHILWLYLGKFDDIDNFSEYAKKELKGEIKFWVCPTKDGTRLALIKIDRFRSDIAVASSLSNEETDAIRWVGPIIYELGRQWISIFNGEISDWLPVATYHNIRLTPKAINAKNTLLHYISLGKIIYKDGQYYAGENGEKALDNDDIKKIKDFYILSNLDSYNKSVRTASEIRKKGEQFEADRYFSSLGISSDKREEFFKKHKNDGTFYFNEGKIIGPGGAIWGSYTTGADGKMVESLFDLDKFTETQRKLGNEGLKRNDFGNRMGLESKATSLQGKLNYNAVGEFLRNTPEGKVDFSKVDAMLLENSKGKRISSLVGHGKILEKEFSYYIYTDASGNVLYYKMSKSQIEDIIRKTTGKSGVVAAKPIQSKSLKEIYTKLIEIIATENVVGGFDRLHGWKIYQSKEERIKKEIDYITNNSGTEWYNRVGERKEPTFGKLYSALIKKGKLIEKIITHGSTFENNRNGAEVFFKDGSKESYTVTSGYWFPERKIIKDSDVDGLNKTILRNQEFRNRERYITAWTPDNKYKQNLDELVEAARNGKIKYEYHADGTIRTENGVAFDTWSGKETPKYDPKNYHGNGGIKSSDLEKDDIYNQIIKKQALAVFNNSDTLKYLFYQKYYGAEIDGDKVWVYDKGRNFRVEINTNLPLEQIKGNNLFKKQSTQGYDWSKKRWVSLKNAGEASKNPIFKWGKTADQLRGHSLSVGFDKIVSELKQSNKTLDLNHELNKMIKDLNQTQVDQGEDSVQAEIERIQAEKEALASAKNQEDYLELLAKKQVGALTEDEKEAILRRIEDRNKMVHVETIREAVNKYGIFDSEGNHMFANETMYTTEDGRHFIPGKNGVAIEVYQDENGKIKPRTYTVKGKKQMAKVNGDHISIFSPGGITNNYKITGQIKIAGREKVTTDNNSKTPA